MYCPDNYDAFDDYSYMQDKAEAEWLAKLPECSECGEPIRDEDCWVIGDEIFCEKCIDGFREYTTNNMKE